MALPSTLYIEPQPWRAGVFGKAINFVPGDPTIPVEVQRASDVSGTGATTIATGLLFPKPGAPYVDQRANDGSSWFYRARHAGSGYDPGAYTSPWVGGVVKAIPKDVLAASVNFGGASVYPIIRSQVMDDGLYILRAFNSSGILADSTVQLDPANGIFEGSVVQKLYRHREEITVYGADADGDVAVSFGQVYQNAPMVLFKGGQYVSFSETLGTGAGAKHRLRLQPVDVTASGFTARAQLVNTGAVTARTADFASGNSITVAGNTVEVDLGANVPANDDTYTVHYFVSVTISSPGTDPNVSLTVAIDSNDGGGWVERATFNYSRASSGTSSWSHEQKAIVVGGIGANDDIRLRAKSFIVHDCTGSFIIRGGDAGGSNPETYNGATWTTATDTIQSAIPANGDQVTWVAQEVT